MPLQDRLRQKRNVYYKMKTGGGCNLLKIGWGANPSKTPSKMQVHATLFSLFHLPLPLSLSLSLLSSNLSRAKLFQRKWWFLLTAESLSLLQAAYAAPRA